MRTLSGSLLLTFRELWAMRLTQGIFLVSTLGLLFLSFAMNLDVVEGSLAAVRIFGFDSTPTDAIKDAETGEWVKQAMTVDNFVIGISAFVFGAAYFLGTLLGLFATMPLIGGFLEQGRIDLLVSKPVSRSRLLGGHLIGVMSTVLVLATYLVGGVWLTMGLKTGVWHTAALLSIPFIVTMFSVMYSVIMTVTIASRSNGLALILSYGLIFLSVILASHEQLLAVLGPSAKMAFNTMYHVLPNFIEVVMIQSQLISGEDVTSWYPLISSILFGVTIHALGFIWFNRRDF